MMNRTRIEWVRNPDNTQGFTWNPLIGCWGPWNDGKLCVDENGDVYCYAYHLAKSRLKSQYPLGFVPTFIDSRLDQPLERKKPARIFACSMADLVSASLPVPWVHSILGVIGRAPQHDFLILTKQPQHWHRFEWPENVWLGLTLDRPGHMRALRQLDYFVLAQEVKGKFISFEPYLEFPIITPNIFRKAVENGLKWIIIGGKTGKNAWSPPEHWVYTLVDYAREHDVAVFLKNNLDLPDKIREFPEGMAVNIR